MHYEYTCHNGCQWADTEYDMDQPLQTEIDNCIALNENA